MAFDQSTRNRLARFVSDARRILTDEFTRQCKQDYGIDPDTGEVSDIARLTHLNDTQRATARILRETLDHYVAGSPSGGKKTSIDRIIREQAFTTLNRLCAVRMAEARGIVIESVGKGSQSKGFALYARVAGSALGETADAYRCYLFSIFDEIALDLPPLFDRFSPKGRLFPSATALDSLLAEINHVDLDPLWGEDETIGWLYQYFNSIEERKQMRDESAAPRNSRELAVRNQFFTPRYVVEFLTDNTLGRIWYEMTKGGTALKDTCRYLVRRPSEIFLPEGQEAPAQEQAPDNLSQEELLKQPVHVPHRPLKDPREIRLLDPACGSMHFGLYAFDLFTVIYDEAWELARGPADARSQSPAFAEFIAFAATFKDKTAFLREVPRLIIEHNIHGIDIDPRAVQIAGLSLWLRAQRAWHQAGVKPAERPRITRSHIVCAEPMPGEKALLQEFVQQQFQESERPVFGYLLDQVFDRMKFAGEAGSLLRIEESIRTSIAEAKRRWRAGPKYEQSPLFPEAVAKPSQGQLRLDLSGITDEQFWERAEQRIYDALRSYSEKAESGGSFQRRLFANDAAQGFAFIDLCRERFDVVLMNPPYGTAAEASKSVLSQHYPSSWIEVYICFCERAIEICRDGIVGALTSRTWMYLQKFSPFRTQILKSRSIRLLTNLGAGVLDDAAVETSAWTFSRRAAAHSTSWFVSVASQHEKAPSLEQACQQVCALSPGGYRLRDSAAFLNEPNASISFEADVRRTIGAIDAADLYDAKPGLGTRDDFRFARLWWEVSTAALESRAWCRAVYGGQPDRFYADHNMVIRWQDSGKEMKTFIAEQYGSASRSIINEDVYYQSGLTYQYTGNTFRVHVLPPGYIITMAGQGLYPREAADKMPLLGVLNTSSATRALKQINPGRFFQASYVKALRFAESWHGNAAELTELVLEAIRLRQLLSRLSETSPLYDLASIDARRLPEQEQPRFLRARLGVIQARLDDIAGECFDGVAKTTEDNAEQEVPESGETIDVGALFGIAMGRWRTHVDKQISATGLVHDVMQQLPTVPPAARRDGAVHCEGAVKYSNALPPRGILASDQDSAWDVVRCVRAVITAMWASDGASVEELICHHYGVDDLRDAFGLTSKFFQSHLERYSQNRRMAPIYWPLSTTSGSYTLWLYYHHLSDQTLFSVVNDFVEPKLQQIASHAATLRGRTSRSSADNAELERLSDFEIELTEFRDELLRLAKVWKPNLNDGVVITASPLWKLFQFKPWQKKLKETWEALEAGEYDWAHLAYSLWPERVREKCKRDKSLAIAHGLEELYQEPPATAGKKRGRKPKAVDPELMEDAE